MIHAYAIILSIIEGITEFLPISSTGHLILTSHLLGITQTEFTKSFDIIIQLGAIMAVVTLYAKKILQNPRILVPISIAFLPTAAIGFTIYKIIKGLLLGNQLIVVCSLFIVGILMVLFEKWIAFQDAKVHKETNIQKLSVKKLIGIGLFQSLSMIPGVSRSAATIMGGMLLGLKRQDAVEFSFLLAVPTMAAASGYDLIKTGASFTPQEFQLLGIGFIVSWITALVATKWFISFVTKHSLSSFGWYRIAVSVLYAFFFLR